MDQLPSYSPPPGAPGVDPARVERFAHALRMRGEGYRPRTRHLGPDGWAKYTNRLFLETSPYLLQHAHNPVDWYSWGDEAFEQARRLGRPVFVSIGYGLSSHGPRRNSRRRWARNGLGSSPDITA